MTEVTIVSSTSEFSLEIDPETGVKVSFTLTSLPPMVLDRLIEKSNEIPSILISALLGAVGAVAVTKKEGAVVVQRTVN